jgi:hypothetical protein
MADQPLEVFLNVYDIQQKSSIVRLNTVTRDLGLGGIFHGAIQLGSAEFSFGWWVASKPSMLAKTYPQRSI